MCVSLYLSEAGIAEGPLESQLPVDTPRRVHDPNLTNMAFFRERMVNRPKRRLTLAARNTDHHVRKRVQKREFLVFSGAGRGSTSSNGGMLDHKSRARYGIPWILHE